MPFCFFKQQGRSFGARWLERRRTLGEPVIRVHPIIVLINYAIYLIYILIQLPLPFIPSPPFLQPLPFSTSPLSLSGERSPPMGTYQP